MFRREFLKITSLLPVIFGYEVANAENWGKELVFPKTSWDHLCNLAECYRDCKEERIVFLVDNILIDGPKEIRKEVTDTSMAWSYEHTVLKSGVIKAFLLVDSKNRVIGVDNNYRSVVNDDVITLTYTIGLGDIPFKVPADMPKQELPKPVPVPD